MHRGRVGRYLWLHTQMHARLRVRAHTESEAYACMHLRVEAVVPYEGPSHIDGSDAEKWEAPSTERVCDKERASYTCVVLSWSKNWNPCDVMARRSWSNCISPAFSNTRLAFFVTFTSDPVSYTHLTLPTIA